MVDSSSIGVGAILSQFNKKGTEHPCVYASRVLTQAKASYSPCHLEASGLQRSIRHFRSYLIGKHFTISTDHKLLISMNKNSLPSPRPNLC
jgi:putative transposase